MNKIDEIPFVVQGLSDTDLDHLRALVQSPVYSVLKKVFSDAIVTQYRQMESVKEVKDIFNLQGRINGMRYCQNAPAMLVQAHEKHQEEKRQSDERMRLHSRRGGLRPEGQ